MEEPASCTVETLLVAHRDELLAFLRRRVPFGASAEDVFQQVAVRALARKERLRNLASARAWLFKIARRVVVDDYRSARGSPDAVAAASDGDAPEQEEFGCGCVMANLQRLPADDARLLRRVVTEGDRIADVARELCLTSNAATVRLHRARVALRAQLLAHCGTKSLRECLDCRCLERRCCEPPAGGELYATR